MLFRGKEKKKDKELSAGTIPQSVTPAELKELIITHQIKQAFALPEPDDETMTRVYRHLVMGNYYVRHSTKDTSTCIMYHRTDNSECAALWHSYCYAVRSFRRNKKDCWRLMAKFRTLGKTCPFYKTIAECIWFMLNDKRVL